MEMGDASYRTILAFAYRNSVDVVSHEAVGGPEGMLCG